MPIRGDRARPRSRLRVLAVLLPLLFAVPVMATPLDFVPVGDPLESELRTLDVLGPGAFGDRLRLPHLFMRPLQRFEIMGSGALPRPAVAAGAISVIRLQRALARDATATFAADSGRSTPRLLQLVYPDDQRLEISTGV